MTERLPGAPRGVCPRCHLPMAGENACEWCGHDAADGAAHRELIERRNEMHALRGDRRARRDWLAAGGHERFMSCPSCGQWGRSGLCEHCHFDATDPVALAARDAHHQHRRADKSRRRAERRLGPRGACPRCWIASAGPGVCEYCTFDAADRAALVALGEERRAAWADQQRRARDRRLRQAWLAERGHHPFMTCPACGQWGRRGLCEHCGFDACDEVAVAARQSWRAARTDQRSARRAEIRGRLAPPSRRRRLEGRLDGDMPAGQAPARRFMTCPACHQWSAAPVCDWCDFDASDASEVAHLVEEALFDRRRGAVRRQQAYSAVRGLVRFDFAEQGRLVAHLLKWIMLGAVVGVLAGVAAAGFLTTLDWATATRLAHPWLLWILPVAGFAVGLAYHYGGRGSGAGNNLIIDEIHDPKAWVPKRMAPLVFVGTVLTHLCGGSAGREGTAIQMSGSLTDGFSRIATRFGLSKRDRRLLLISAIGGGFGAVFHVPLAGCIFALEVQAVGRIRYDALIPALSASIVGNIVVDGLGVGPPVYLRLPAVALSPALIAKVVVAGLVFGLAAVAFAELTHGIKKVFSVTVRWAPARPLIGGLLVVGLTYAVGNRDYLGLSVPLITRSLAGGVGIVAFAFALKLVFTSLTLGAGFQGGEVTPLFVIGATLGATLGHLLGVPVPLMAALGFVAVFAGATNTPLACTVMGVELFGSGPLVLLAVACVTAYVFSSHRGIYGTQRVDTPKAPTERLGGDSTITINDVALTRRHWLPAVNDRGGVAEPVEDEEDEEAG